MIDPHRRQSFSEGPSILEARLYDDRTTGIDEPGLVFLGTSPKPNVYRVQVARCRNLRVPLCFSGG
jgi:hypothetical protein